MQPLRVISYVEDHVAANGDKDRASSLGTAAPCVVIRAVGVVKLPVAPCSSCPVQVSSVAVPGHRFCVDFRLQTSGICVYQSCTHSTRIHAFWWVPGLRLFSAPPDSSGAAGAAAFRNWLRAASFEGDHCSIIAPEHMIGSKPWAGLGRPWWPYPSRLVRRPHHAHHPAPFEWLFQDCVNPPICIVEICCPMEQHQTRQLRSAH